MRYFFLTLIHLPYYLLIAGCTQSNKSAELTINK